MVFLYFSLLVFNILCQLLSAKADEHLILNLESRAIPRQKRPSHYQLLKRDVNASEPLLVYFNVTDLQYGNDV